MDICPHWNKYPCILKGLTLVLMKMRLANFTHDLAREYFHSNGILAAFSCFSWTLKLLSNGFTVLKYSCYLDMKTLLICSGSTSVGLFLYLVLFNLIDRCLWRLKPIGSPVLWLERCSQSWSGLFFQCGRWQGLIPWWCAVRFVHLEQLSFDT